MKKLNISLKAFLFHFNFRALAVLLLLTSSLFVSGQTIDLELSLHQAVSAPAQWSNYSVVATISNNGPDQATGVKVDFPIADGIVYVGADLFSLSQGTFAIYNDESWTVGNLDAGASATLTINYFNKVEVAPVSYAQVKSANETDSDSTPGNGTPPTPNEDDEASTNGSNSTQELELICNEDIIVETHDSNSNVICANTTHVFLPSATTDELNCGAAVVEFVDYNVVEGTVYVQVALGGYCNAILVGGFGIVDLNFIATDGCGNSKTCTQRVERKEIYVDINFVDCKNYTVQAAPGATGAIVNYDIPSIEYTGCSNGGPIVALVTGLPSGSEFPIGVSTVVYEATECNNANDFCEFQITVEPANTGGDGIDLELTMSQSVPAPAQWSSYSVDVNLKNNGPSTATGVEVSFPKPDGVVYVGGNQFSLTAGDFEVYGNQVWTVPSLSPGEEVSLQVNYFSLQANAAVAYAQVIAANESDVDSTPGNGTPPTPNEDDEASSESTGPPNPMDSGCYFDKTIDTYESMKSVLFVDEQVNGEVELTLLVESTSTTPVYSIVKTILSEEGTLISEDVLGIVSNINYEITKEGFISIGTNGIRYTNFSGQTIWENTFDIPGSTSGVYDDVAKISDGEFLITGHFTKTSTFDDFYPFYIKVDAQGNQIDFGEGEQLISYGNVEFQSESESDYYFIVKQAGGATIILTKTTKSFDEIWHRIFTASYGMRLTGFGTDDNENTYVGLSFGLPTGQQQPVSSAGRLLCIDANGNDRFDRYLTTGFNTAGGVSVQVVEGGVVATFTSGDILKLAKFTIDNEVVFEKEFTNSGLARTLAELTDGGILFAGLENEKLRLRKTTSLGNLMPACSPDQKADLTLENIKAPLYTHSGDEVDVYFDVKNIGDALTNTGGNAIRIYLKENSIDNPSDIFLGEIPTPSLGAGESALQERSGIIIPNIPEGTHYIFVRVDTNNVIDESNEDNNTIFTEINVIPSTIEGTCDLPISAGEFVCAKTNPDGSNSIVLKDGTSVSEIEIYGDGTLGAMNSLPDDLGPELVYVTNNNVAKKIAGSNDNIYSKPISQTIIDNYAKIVDAVEFNGGFILVAYKNYDPVANSYDAIWAIRTDSDLNPIIEKEILDGGSISQISIVGGLQVNSSQITLISGRGETPNYSRSLVVLNEDLTIESNSEYVSGYSGNLYIRPTTCGSFLLVVSESTGFCIHGSCYKSTLYYGNFVNGNFEVERSRFYSSFTSVGYGQEIIILRLNTQDGGTIEARYEQAVPLSLNPRANIIVTKSLNGVDQANYVVETEAKATALLEIGGAPYLLVDNDGVMELVELNCIEPVTVTPVDYCDVQSDFPWHEWFSKVNINQQVIWESGKNVYSDFSNDAPVAALERGADAGYVFDITYSYFSYTGYIKYYVDFNQNGIFEESEGGSVISDPIAAGTNVVSTVAATHTILSEAKLGETKARFILSRDPITSACDNVAYGEIEDYKVMIVDDLPNARLAKVNSNYDVYPNPVVDEVNIDISDIPNVNNISLYNAYGQLMLSKDLSRKSLDSVIKLNTSSLLDGAYFLHLSGEGFKSQGKMIIVQRLN